ncbi:ribose-5-phosphate isomerase RpiA [Novosphingobium sp. G106]|uniref:ribose-5-phosphate isomerase RpiA n=1 Tax=Novosphingobium sp. G106 TaxID=2849500 RepID=UPI001C2CCD7C|nr:ribose-5-phosphate isomerase RpiA [Novosphingobium sp. G106]MBV1691081.1 ribose-5-phosphate isomerase RpiA [Novosphingobium sp. G106]
MARNGLHTESWKRASAEAAVAEVADGMLVGLGTGTTAAFAIAALARRLGEGLRCRGVATSLRTADSARAARIPLLTLEEVAEVDLCIDGVDEIDAEFRAIKGAGGAMLREKIVASAARRMIAIADASKAVARLGARPVPVEALPSARAYVERQLARLDCTPILRRNDAGAPVTTDQGNLIFDCHFAALDDPAGTATRLSFIPGMLGHGLFLSEIDALYLGTADGVVRTERNIA